METFAEMLKQKKCQIFLIPRSLNLCKWTDSKNLEHLEIPRIQNMKDAAFCENCQQLPTVSYFCKTLHLGVRQGSEFGSAIHP